MVLPAAGRSRRMGAPKLLIQLDGESLIQRLIRQLQGAAIHSIHILIREDDEALLQEVEQLPVMIETTPVDTLDMRASVQRLLDAIDQRHGFRPGDGWLLIPADHPIVTPGVLGALLRTWEAHPEAILSPEYQGRRGHPTIFPSSAIVLLRELPEGLGANQLLRDPRLSVIAIPVDEPTIHWDLDTPEDVRRFLSWLG